jgi:hypothetical protein
MIYPDCYLFTVKVPFEDEGEIVLLMFSCAKVNAGVINRSERKSRVGLDGCMSAVQTEPCDFL